MREKIEHFIDSIETLDLGLIWWVLGFLAIVFGRNFLEGIWGEQYSIGLHSTPSLSAAMFFNHFPLFWISLFFALVLLLHFLTGERIERVSKAAISFWSVILLPPILDILFFGGGYRLTYFGNIREFPYILLNIFNPFVQIEGTSPGLRIEVLVGAILVVTYTWIKRRSIIKSICGFFGFQIILGIAGFLPAIFATVFGGVTPELAYANVFRSGGIVQTESQRLALLFTFSSLFLFCLWGVRYNREKWRAVVSNMRPLRSIHYTGLTLLGILLGVKLFKDAHPLLFDTPVDFLASLGLLFSVFFIFQSAVALNDIFDIECDKISNKSRPLVKKQLTLGDMRILAIVYLLIAFFFAINVRYSSFILVLVCAILSFVYSVPPLRLRRVFPLSSFIIGLAALCAMLVGFSIFGDEKSVYIFPKSLTLLLLVTFTLASSIKDLKDVEGDRKTGVRTLPVLLGEHRGRIVIAFLLLFSYLLIAPILQMPILFIPAILFGGLSMVIILKKRASEKAVFVLYFIFAIMLAFFIRKNIDILKTPSESVSGHSTAHFLTGEIYLQRGELAKAIKEYETARMFGKSVPELHRQLGYSYLRMGSVEKAIFELERAYSLNPDDAKTIGFLGQAYLWSGDVNAAITKYKDAINNGRRVREMHLLLGRAYMAQSMYEDAVKAFETAIALGEGFEACYLDLVEARARLGTR